MEFSHEKMQPGTIFTAFLRCFMLFRKRLKTTVKHDVFNDVKNVKNTVKIAKKRSAPYDLAFRLGKCYIFCQKNTNLT